MADTHKKDLIRSLDLALPGRVTRGVKLSDISRWQVGGRARYLIEPRSCAETAEVIRHLREVGVKYCIVGSTSNLLFDSAGFNGALVRIGERQSNIEVMGRRLVAQGGASVPDVSWAAARAGLSGVEHIVGIPGTIGGLVLMNGGSQRKGIGENVVRVTCVDAEGKSVELNHEMCEFSYRGSRLQHAGLVIVEVELELSDGDPALIQDSLESILASRASRFPLDLPNCGSTFLSDPRMYSTVGPPGKVIESVGLKGLRKGAAQISPKHANFIVNLGDATSDDILWLIAYARERVHAATGFWLNCEVRYVAADGSILPAHVAAMSRWGASSLAVL